MSRPLPTYTADRIREAVTKAEAETGWPDARIAAIHLAGWQADDVAMDHAREQVVEWLAREHVEGAE